MDKNPDPVDRLRESLDLFITQLALSGDDAAFLSLDRPSGQDSYMAGINEPTIRALDTALLDYIGHTRCGGCRRISDNEVIERGPQGWMCPECNWRRR